MEESEITSAGFGYMSLQKAGEKYPLDNLAPGKNVLNNGESVFYIPNPAVGLWASDTTLHSR